MKSTTTFPHRRKPRDPQGRIKVTQSKDDNDNDNSELQIIDADGVEALLDQLAERI